jgi:Glycosyl transferases group 1
MPHASFIFAHKSTDVWSTPLSILKEFEGLGWTTNIVTLFDHKERYCSDELIDFVHCQELYNPDIILFFDYGRYDSQWLDKKHFLNSFFVGEMGDEGQNFNNNFPKSHKFDLIHTPDHQCHLKYKEAGRKVLHLPHFADTRIHKQYKGSDTFPPVRSTRGPGSSFILDSLSQIMPEKFLNKNGMVGEEYGSFLNNGKITVQHSRHQEITRRIFEGMAAGTLVLTDKLPSSTKIDELFTEGEDYVTYQTLTDCISKINFYLNNESERVRIAQNGMNKTLQHHTQVQRVQQILKAYQEWKTK